MKNKQFDRNFITQGSLNKVILSISVPLMLNNLVRTLYNLTDGLFVAQISAEDFAATAFVWPLNFLFISVGMGIGIGATALIAQQMGGNHYQSAKHYADNTILLSLILGFLAALIGYLATPSLIYWMGARDGLYEKSVIYLQINFIGLFFDFVYFGYQAILNAQGQTKSITIISIISSLTNVILDPLFIFDNVLGLPGLNMGIVGAAYATVISKIALYLLGIRIVHKYSEISVSVRKVKVDRQILTNISKVAFPSAMGYGGSALGFTVLNGLIASYGTNTLAAYSMVNRITDLLNQPQLGIGAALTSIVGQNIGSGNFDRAKAIFKRAIYLILALSLISSLTVLIGRYQILSIFIKGGSDPELWTQAIEYLYFSAFIIFFMGLFSALNGFFQGTGQTKYAMYLSVGRLWALRLPIIWALGIFTDLGSMGIWIAMLLSNMLVVVYGFYIYRSRDWHALT
ncbi:MATE family efflux transporter [Fundicoccus sp. Sow4_D5]|uniref:MATE family efflux transporter n=1 Tax=unclassified Fundicoccus TaxID=2761543 RepID=UPI003F92E0D8